ncbi:MAG: ABC transporter permease [Janthinobacterium lividum]
MSYSLIRRCMALIAWLVLAILVAPIVIMVGSAFTAGQVPFPWHGFSFKWLIDACNRTDFIAAIGRSLLFCVLVTLVNLMLGTAVAISVTRGRLARASWIDWIVLSPLMVPTSVFAFSALAIASAMHLLGTNTLVLVAYVVITFPLTTRTLVGVFQQVDVSIEQAARISGAGHLEAFFQTTFRIALTGIFVSSVLSFVLVLDESVVIIFLGSVQTATFPMKLFSYISEQYDPLASAYGFIIFAFTMVLMLVVHWTVGFDSLRSNISAKGR